MNTVVIHGAYKGDNFGDTLLLAILSCEANRLGWKVLASRTCEASAAHLADSCRIERLTHPDQLKAAKALVYGGGGFFGEQPQGKLRWNLRFIRDHIPIGLRFLMDKKPYGCIGTGFGPLSFWPARKLAAFLLKRAGVVCLRDQASKDYLVKYGVPEGRIDVSADLALTLVDNASAQIDQYHFPKAKSGPVILLHPSYGVQQDEQQRQFAEALKRTLDANPNAEVWLTSDHKSSTNQTETQWTHFLGIAPEKIFPYKSPWKTCALIKAADIIISNKLHVTIVAAAYGKTVLSVAKHPKNIRFFDQIARPELCQMRDDFDPELFARQLEQAINGTLPPIRLPAAVIKQARMNFDKLEQFLGKA